MILFVALLFGNSLSAGELATCANGILAPSLACTNAAHGAKKQADALTSQLTKFVASSSLKEAADMEARVTAQIRSIYQSAHGVCSAANAACQNACKGKAASVASACGRDFGKHLSQLAQGAASNLNGHNGSTLSSQRSTGRAAGGSGGAPAAASAADSSPRPGGAPLAYSDRAFVTQKAVAGSGARAGSVGSYGASGKGSSGEYGAQSNSANGDSKGSSNSGISAETEAALALCRSKNARIVAMAIDCQKLEVGKFCADPGHSMCPSCQRKTAADLVKADNKYFAQACHTKCLGDVALGPKLADACRAYIGGGGGSTMGDRGGSNSGKGESKTASKLGRADVPSRRPANVLAGVEVAGGVSQQWGPSLFKILTATIQQRCQLGKLNHCH